MKTCYERPRATPHAIGPCGMAESRLYADRLADRSAQGVDERMINVRYYYYYIEFAS